MYSIKINILYVYIHAHTYYAYFIRNTISYLYSNKDFL